MNLSFTDCFFNRKYGRPQQYNLIITVVFLRLPEKWPLRPLMANSLYIGTYTFVNKFNVFLRLKLLNPKYLR